MLHKTLKQSYISPLCSRRDSLMFSFLGTSFLRVTHCTGANLFYTSHVVLRFSSLRSRKKPGKPEPVVGKQKAFKPKVSTLEYLNI